MKIFLLVICICLSFHSFASAQAATVDSSSVNAPAIRNADSIPASSALIVLNNDSTSAVKASESKVASVPSVDIADSEKTLPRIPIVKRNLHYRAQIGAAFGMMTFILVIMGSTQNWNP